MRGDLRLVTDGKVAPEGAQWDAPVGGHPSTRRPARSPTTSARSASVSAFVLQADANDSYKIFGVARRTRPAASSCWSRSRASSTSATACARAPVTHRPDDGPLPAHRRAAGRQLLLDLRVPGLLPRARRRSRRSCAIVDAPPARVVEAPWYEVRLVGQRRERALRDGAGARRRWRCWAGALAATRRGRRGTTAQAARRPADRASASLSFCAYWNFGLVPLPQLHPLWDTFHYYVGSKYFNELSYDRLYECVAVADAEEPGAAPPRRAAQDHEPAHQHDGGRRRTILAHPEDCKKHFTPERWEAFKKDVAYFRGKPRRQALGGGADRPRLQRHAGLEHRRARRWRTPAPASDGQIDCAHPDRSAVHRRHDADDLVGVRLAHDCASRWRCSRPTSRRASTGRAARSCAGTGCSTSWAGSAWCKKDKPLLGGFFLGYSTLLRVFPVFVLHRAAAGRRCGSCGAHARRPTGAAPAGGSRSRVAPLRDARERCSRASIAATWRCSAARRWRSRCWCRSAWSPAAASTATRRSSSTREKHKETPLTNHMGLRTVVDLQPVGGGALAAATIALEDPWGAWKQAKVAHLPAARCRSTCCSSRGFVGAAVRGAARRRAVGRLLAWAR